VHLSLTKCSISELDELLELSRTTFVDAFAHLNNPIDFRAYMEQAFASIKVANELRDPNIAYYFVNCDGKTTAYFKLNYAMAQTDPHDPDALELERIYVHKDFQGKSIGRWMISEILGLAKIGHVSFLWLSVWEKNQRAIRFYESCGLKKFAKRPFFIGKDKQTDWLMRYDIPKL
jgi:ribosomal protein S18 acetylase RimI-like enzyme